MAAPWPTHIDAAPQHLYLDLADCEEGEAVPARYAESLDFYFGPDNRRHRRRKANHKKGDPIIHDQV